MPIPPLYTVDEIAALTHAPKASVEYWIYSGRLASVKVGRRRLVTEVMLRKFLGLEK